MLKLNDLCDMYNITPDPTGPTKAKTPVARTSYCFVHHAKETPSGDMKFTTCLIFNKDEKQALKPVAIAIVNAASKKFGADPTKWPKNLKCPLRDGDEERDNAEYENSLFLNAGNKNKPGIVGRDLQPIMEESEFYSGCFCRASLSFYPYDVKGNKGVGCGLNNVMFWEHGGRLDGSTSAGDDFKEFADSTDAATTADDDSNF